MRVHREIAVPTKLQTELLQFWDLLKISISLFSVLIWKCNKFSAELTGDEREDPKGAEMNWKLLQRVLLSSEYSVEWWRTNCVLNVSDARRRKKLQKKPGTRTLYFSRAAPTRIPFCRSVVSLGQTLQN